MEPDITLHQMTAYDFKYPITAIINLEESDDDDSLNISSSTSEHVITTLENRSLPIIDIEFPAASETDCRLTNVIESNPTLQEYYNNIQHNTTQSNPPQNVGSLYQKNLHESVTNINSESLPSCTDQRSSMSYEPVDVNNTSADEDVSKITSAYIKELFNIISEHIIIILKAYYHYKTVQHNSNYEKDYIERSWKHFHNFKQHYFNLSYSTLKVLFLPEHKNDKFNQAFLKRTLKTAHRHGFYCTYSQLNDVYSEMIFWLTMKAQTQIPHYYIEKPNQRLREEINKPLKSISKPSKRVAQTDKSKDPKLQRIFLAGPPGRQIQINVNQKDLQYSHSQQNTYNNRQISRPLCAASQNSNNNGNNYNLSTHGNLTGHYRILHDNSIIQNNNNTLPTTVCPWPETPDINKSPQQNMNIQCGSLNNSGIQPHLNTFLKENQRGLISDQSNVRSSVSRDSGFISPPNFNAQTEPPPPPYPSNFEDTRNSAPETTPPFREIGKCHICGKVTYSQCGRCFKTYYCSAVCQTANWHYHKEICTKS